MKAKFGLGTWITVIGPFAGQEWSLDRCIQTAQKQGWDFISPGGFGKHVSPDIYNTATRRAQLLAKVEDAGLALGPLAANVWKYPFWADGKYQAGNAKKLLRHMVSVYKMSSDLGIKAVRADTSVLRPDNLSEETAKIMFDRAVAIQAKNADNAAAAGIKLLFEMEPAWIFLDEFDEAERFLLAVREQAQRDVTAHTGLIYDTTHVEAIRVQTRSHRSQLEVIEQLGSYIHGIHIADSLNGARHKGDSTHPPTGQHFPIGEGNLPLDEILPALDALPNVGDERTLDLCFWAGTDEDLFANQLSRLHTLYAKASVKG